MSHIDTWLVLSGPTSPSEPERVEPIQPVIQRTERARLGQSAQQEFPCEKNYSVEV